METFKKKSFFSSLLWMLGQHHYGLIFGQDFREDVFDPVSRNQPFRTSYILETVSGTAKMNSICF